MTTNTVSQRLEQMRRKRERYAITIQCIAWFIIALRMGTIALYLANGRVRPIIEDLIVIALAALVVGTQASVRKGIAIERTQQQHIDFLTNLNDH